MPEKAPKFLSIGWFRGMLSRAPQVVESPQVADELPDLNAQAELTALLEEGVGVLILAHPLLLAMGTARRAAMSSFERGESTEVSASARFPLRGKLCEPFVYIDRTDRKLVALTMSIKGPESSEGPDSCSWGIDLRVLNKPKTFYQGSKPDSKSKSDVENIRTSIDDLRKELSPAEQQPAVPAQN